MFLMNYTAEIDTVFLFEKRRKVQRFLQRLKRLQALLVLEDRYFTIYSSTDSSPFMTDTHPTLCQLIPLCKRDISVRCSFGFPSRGIIQCAEALLGGC